MYRFQEIQVVRNCRGHPLIGQKLSRPLFDWPMASKAADLIIPPSRNRGNPVGWTFSFSVWFSAEVGTHTFLFLDAILLFALFEMTLHAIALFSQLLLSTYCWFPARLPTPFENWSAEWCGVVILKKCKFSQKIPVYIGYFTSWVDDDGTVNFYKDIYKCSWLNFYQFI